MSKLNNLNEIITYYYENGTFRNLRHTGIHTDTELIGLTLKYINILNSKEEDNNGSEISGLSSDEKLKYHLLLRKLQLTYKFDPYRIRELEPYLLSKRIYLPKLLEIFIFQSAYFEPKGKDILKNIIYNLNDSTIIGNRHGFSTERIRQLKIAFERQLNDRVSIFYSFIRDIREFCKYEGLILTNKFVIADSNFFKSIKDDKETISDEILLLSVRLLNENFTLYRKGIKLSCRQKGYSSTLYYRYNITKNNYLISNEFLAFELIMLLNYTLQFLCLMHKEDILLDDKIILFASVVGFKHDYTIMQNKLLEFDAHLRQTTDSILLKLKLKMVKLLEGAISGGIKSFDGSILLKKGETITSEFINSIDPSVIINYNWTCSDNINSQITSLISDYSLEIQPVENTYEFEKSTIISNFKMKYSTYQSIIDNILFAEYGLIRKEKSLFHETKSLQNLKSYFRF